MTSSRSRSAPTSDREPLAELEEMIGKDWRIFRDRLIPPMAIQISQAGQDHHAMLRSCYYEGQVRAGKIHVWRSS